MKKPQTLGDYRDMCLGTFGDGKSVAYFDKKIEEEGAEARVLAEESQVLYMVMCLEGLI